MYEYIIYFHCSLAIIGIALLFFNNSKGDLRRRVEGLKKEGGSRLSETALLKKRKNQEIDKEVAESISFLRNLLLLGTGRRMSRDFVITRLSRKDGYLKPAFLGMLSRLRVNQREEAMDFFSSYAGTSRAREFAGVLLQWDDLDPLALSEILLSHQKSIGEIRMTEKIRRDETISDLIYLPVVINVLVICVNFIYTSYYLKQQEMFQLLF